MSALRSRWRTRELVGDAKHALIVRLRPGHFIAGYLNSRRIDDGTTPFNGSWIYPPLLWKGNNQSCFKKRWEATGNWVELPNIVSVKWSIAFDIQTGGEKGGTTATIVMDNISFPDVTGPAGLYHTIDRGHFSPGRGLRSVYRPSAWSKDVKNQWQNVLNAGWQVEIWEGYGSGTNVQLLTTLNPTTNSYAPASGALSRTFTGLVVDCELDSHPDQITLTVQDFSITLTDQRVAGWNKALEIPSPVIFADRNTSQGEVEIDGPYTVSGGSAVTGKGVWTSASHSSPDPSPRPWIEMKLPRGHYEDFFVAVDSPLKAYLSIYMNGEGTINRVWPTPTGWVDLTGRYAGTGTIDGIPYVRSMTVTDAAASRWSLGFPYDVPDGSRLRLTFSNLTEGPDHLFYAGTEGFSAYRFNTDPAKFPAGNIKGWVLIEDCADIIKMVLIWAGFQEWHIENFGWSLFNPVYYGSSKYLMDIITDALQTASYIFYMGQPTNDDRSIGVPHFEHIAALDPPKTGMLEVRDTDMTEAMSCKWDLTNLPDILRYAGAITNKGGAYVLGYGIEGLTQRYRATYYPPWSASFVGLDGLIKKIPGVKGPAGLLLRSYTAGVVPRDGSINRQFTETMGTTYNTQLESNDECLFACVLAAIQYGLNMVTVQFQIPGVAPINLNDQMVVLDEAAAINSRVWVTEIDSEHVTGGGEQPGYWRYTISGSLIDVAEMDAMRNDYNTAWRLCQRSKVQIAGAGAK